MEFNLKRDLIRAEFMENNTTLAWLKNCYLSQISSLESAFSEIPQALDFKNSLIKLAVYFLRIKIMFQESSQK